MNNGDLDALFKALLSRKQDDAEKLYLYKRRDALPPAMRESPSVLAELILQFDHEQRMIRIAGQMQESASKTAKRTSEETIQRCLQEVSGAFTTLAAISIEKIVKKVEQETTKRVQNENGREVYTQTYVAFVAGTFFSLLIILATNRLGLR